MMSKSGGVSTWQVDKGFAFKQYFEATSVVFHVGVVVLGVVLVMQALP